MEATLHTDVFPPPPFEVELSSASESSRFAASSGSGESSAAPAQAPIVKAPDPACPILRLLSQSAGGAEVRALGINLERRPDRWEQFVKACPLQGVMRFPAIDGRKCRPPTWWRQGGGAWGCMLSHIGILQQALMDGLDQRGGVLLVLEDDALFPPDFTEKAQRFIAALPRD